MSYVPPLSSVYDGRAYRFALLVDLAAEEPAPQRLEQVRFGAVLGRRANGALQHDGVLREQIRRRLGFSVLQRS